MEDIHSNKLVDESSPYLLQHAYNPVHWYPWGDEALQRAKSENKMIIVSVGYAACHWCHVMEHESFEDSLVAEFMNEHFISIKVDREERPDVDDVYMTACHLVSGRGGWPLNAFALPDGKPFWAGTYFPKDKWLELLQQFVDMYQNNPEKLEDSASKITKGIQNRDAIVSVDQPSQLLDEDRLRFNLKQYTSTIDTLWGGNDRTPKFPMPNNFEMLLNYGITYKDSEAIEAVKLTLDKMMMGGIYDQLGGGFSRYSTDRYWKVPHFEKMLYDNAQLVSLYAKAFMVTKDEKYHDVVRETLQFLECELRSPEGVFYSSLDADSEGEEGKFYTWTYEELEEIFEGFEDKELFYEYYNSKPTGNWDHTNILYRTSSDEDFMDQHRIANERLTEVLDQGRKLLWKHRMEKERPRLDDKILTSWNALMISAYLDAYVAFGEESYLTSASRINEFIQEEMMTDEYRLLRNHKNGKSSINGFLDDYALYIHSLLDFYQTTLQEDHLQLAQHLMRYVYEHFDNQESQMFNYTSDIDEPLIARKAEIADNVIPSSNSVMARNLQTLGELFYDRKYIDRSTQMLSNLDASIFGNPTGIGFYSNWIQCYMSKMESTFEVAIVGENMTEVRSQFYSQYLPNVMFLGSKSKEYLPLLANKHVEDETIIYVCQNKSCKLPVQTMDAALKLMK